MKKFTLSGLLLIVAAASFAQLQRPRLVVGIVVDQMRWDYLYRYYNKFGNDGFKRLLGDGFSCGNTLINYLPSYTAVGHTTIFTGSVPSIDGIAGNSWRIQATGKTTYCTDDSTVSTVGAPGNAGKMSPHNLWVTTLTDELRLATNFQSKVVGVSLKDRASILPAGHHPTGAYWLDDASGNFITSTYYRKELPAWVNDFNKEKNIDKLIADGWNTLLPINQYTESTQDNEPWEGKYKGVTAPVFPYDFKKIYAANKENLRASPFGNALTLQFAEAAVAGEQLGQGAQTDFLTINCASTDYSGHQFGPNSIEVEDVYLRLDKNLGEFFNYLDNKIGKGNYMVFLTADHGAAHAEGFMEANKMPTGFSRTLTASLNQFLQSKTGEAGLVLGLDNDAVSFDNKLIVSKGLDKEKIKQATVDFLQQQPQVLYAIDEAKTAGASIPQPLRDMIINGYNRQRTGDVKFILQSGFLPEGYKTGTTHGLWNPYDTHIPLLFYGWKIPHGESNATVHMTDIAPTVAALLHIQMPSGCIGAPITAITDKVNGL